MEVQGEGTSGRPLWKRRRRGADRGRGDVVGVGGCGWGRIGEGREVEARGGDPNGGCGERRPGAGGCRGFPAGCARERESGSRRPPAPPAHLLLLFLLPGRAAGFTVVTRGHPGARYHLIFLSARRRGARDEDRAKRGGRRGGTVPGGAGTGTRAGHTAAAVGRSAN